MAVKNMEQEKRIEVGIWKPMEGVNHHFDNFVRSQGQLCG